ncbi:MAG: helix-turn-helix transcriptional regulator [Verrucomicrobiales bacterium]|nr:helix-turn-helix transcriptional regulator [Verrucomicrobiales bacterium]
MPLASTCLRWVAMWITLSATVGTFPCSIPGRRLLSTIDEEIQNLRFAHSRGRRAPVEVIRLSELRRRSMKHDIFAPTRLDFHALQFVLKGTGAHWVDFARHSLKQGDVLQIRSDQVHAFDAESNHEALLLLFRPETIPPEPMRRLTMFLDAPVPLAKHEFSSFVQLLDFIRRIDGMPEEKRLTSMAPGLLDAIISGLDEIITRGNATIRTTHHHRASELVYRFENSLQSGSRRHPVSEYAAQLHVTQRTLARACQAIRGRSPKQLMDRHFTMEAKRRLILGDDTVEEIAFDLGFSESTNFVKFFKRIAGTTPDAFRVEQKNHSSE